jgi:hypothetical protein
MSAQYSTRTSQRTFFDLALELRLRIYRTLFYEDTLGAEPDLDVEAGSVNIEIISDAAIHEQRNFCESTDAMPRGPPDSASRSKFMDCDSSSLTLEGHVKVGPWKANPAKSWSRHMWSRADVTRQGNSELEHHVSSSWYRGMSSCLDLGCLDLLHHSR